MCTDLVTSHPSASLRSFPTATQGDPSPWGNLWINIFWAAYCSWNFFKKIKSIFHETAAQILVIILSHSLMQGTTDNVKKEKQQPDKSIVLTRMHYLSEKKKSSSSF